MRLLRLSENAHTLETAAGALLFSYEGIAAVRFNKGPGVTSAAVFRAPGAVLSVATRAHLIRFAPGPRLPPALSVRQFADLCRQILTG